MPQYEGREEHLKEWNATFTKKRKKDEKPKEKKFDLSTVSFIKPESWNDYVFPHGIDELIKQSNHGDFSLAIGIDPKGKWVASVAQGGPSIVVYHGE